MSIVNFGDQKEKLVYMQDNVIWIKKEEDIPWNKLTLPMPKGRGF